MRRFDVHTHCGPWNSIPGAAWDDEALVRVLRQTGVEKAMLSSVAAVLTDLLAGNLVTQAAIEKHEMLYGYIYVDARRVDDSLAQVESLRTHPKFLGLKSRDDYHGLPYNGPAYRRIFAGVAEPRLPALLHTFSVRSIESALDLAADYPAPLILTHMGGSEWRGCERLLGREIPRNVYLDPVSSFSEPGKYELALALVGPDNLLFGTDCTLFHPCLSIGAIESSTLTEEVKRKLYWENAERVFGAGSEPQMNTDGHG
jgi:predicted TIM-barrel fold metal-dependent hydrolase